MRLGTLRSRDRTQIPCCPCSADESWSRIPFQVQGNGITLLQLAKRFLVFCGSRKNGLDGIEKVLCCKVLSALPWEDDAVWFKGLCEEMSYPTWCWVHPGVVGVRQDLLWWPSSPESCRRCERWEELWGVEQWLTVHGWETPEKGCAFYGVQLSLAVFKECLWHWWSLLCQQKVLTDPWTREQLFTEGLCIDIYVTSSKVHLWESLEILVTLCTGWWREGRGLEANDFVNPHKLNPPVWLSSWWMGRWWRIFKHWV